jgi:hypothetical protein
VLRSVNRWGELGIWQAFVWQEMGFGQTGMFKLDEKVLDVAGHTDATPAGCVVPFDIYTRKFVVGHVELDPVKLLENIAEMVEVFKPNILHPNIIKDETDLDGTPYVAPEVWGGFGFVISFSKKAGSEEILCKNAGLGKAITALTNFKVDPTVMIATLKFVVLNEFHQNVCNFNMDIFRVRHQSIEVEILEVNGAEMYAWAKKHAVEKQIEEFEGRSVGSHITLEADAVAADGGAGAIRIILFRPHFTYHHGVADFLPCMDRDVVIVYKEEGVSACNPFCVGGRTQAYALA